MSEFMSIMPVRPPHLSFELVESEDRNASIEAGYYVSIRTPYVVITQPGAQDNVKLPASEWLKNLPPGGWQDTAKTAYGAWIEGNEMPEYGTPIMTYLPFSPNQRDRLIAVGIRTLEDCAAMSEQAISRFGTGGRELSERAKTALSSANVLAATVDSLRAEIESLKAPKEKKRKEKIEQVA